MRTLTHYIKPSATNNTNGKGRMIAIGRDLLLKAVSSKAVSDQQLPVQEQARWVGLQCGYLDWSQGRLVKCSVKL